MPLNKKIRFNIKNEALAVSVFSFLSAIVIALFVLKKDIYSLKSFVNVFSYQIKNIEISKGRMLLFVFEKRLMHFFVLLLFSGFIKKKYKSLMFYAGFFFLYGIFFIVNIYMLGIKGVLTGLLLMVPHWLIYFCVYSKLFRYESEIKNYIRLFEILVMILALFIASVIETYVNISLIYNIL